MVVGVSAITKEPEAAKSGDQLQADESV